MNFGLPQVEDFNHDDPRYWYIAGLALSSGVIPPSWNYNTSITLTNCRAFELDILQTFIINYVKAFESLRMPEPTSTKTEFGTTLAGRCIGSLFKRLGEVKRFNSYRHVGDLISTFSGANHKIDFLAAIGTDDAYSGFMAGVLAGTTFDSEGRRLTHKNSLLLRVLHEILFDDFGIPTEIDVNPHEDAIKHTARLGNTKHNILLPRRHYLKVHAAGLALLEQDVLNGCAPQYGATYRVPGATALNPYEQFAWTCPELLNQEVKSATVQADLHHYVDRVASVQPAGPHRAVRLIGSNEVDFHSFRIRLSFTPPDVALDLAADPVMFTDVENPTCVIANSHPVTTNRHGAI